MINLEHMVEPFLGEAILRQKELQELDDLVIDTLNDRSRDEAMRVAEVRRWLRYYAVFQGLNESERDGAARTILEFADCHDLAAQPKSEGEIIELFNDLYSKCSARVRLRNDQTQRDVTSLSSKGLWCCFPHFIPMFDSYALRGLWAISRLIGLDRPAQGVPYTRFAIVWLDLYRRIEHMFDNRLDGYPYKVRVFDKILWIVGQPDFGVVPYRTVSR